MRERQDGSAGCKLDARPIGGCLKRLVAAAVFPVVTTSACAALVHASTPSIAETPSNLNGVYATRVSTTALSGALNGRWFLQFHGGTYTFNYTGKTSKNVIVSGVYAITREEVAKEITRIHCDATGAPASFVNVLFHETQEGRYFVGERSSRHSIVFGAIRKGRDIETRQAMLSGLSQMWKRLTGQPEGEVLVTLTEVPAENMIEGGLILPEPGHEHAWFEEHSARLAKAGMT